MKIEFHDLKKKLPPGLAWTPMIPRLSAGHYLVVVGPHYLIGEENVRDFHYRTYTLHKAKTAEQIVLPQGKRVYAIARLFEEPINIAREVDGNA